MFFIENIKYLTFGNTHISLYINIHKGLIETAELLYWRAVHAFARLIGSRRKTDSITNSESKKDQILHLIPGASFNLQDTWTS